MPDIRLALYDTAVIVDTRTGEVGLWAWDLTGEGHAATERRCRAWRKALDRALRSPPADPASRRWDLRPVNSTARPISRPLAACSNTSRPATSSRSTCRNDSRPGDVPSRWTSTCGSKPRAPHRSRRSSTGTTWRSSRPARSGSTRRGATCWSPGRSRGRGLAVGIPTTTRGSPPSCAPHPRIAPS